MKEPQSPEEYKDELYRELVRLEHSHSIVPTEYKEERIARLKGRLGVKDEDQSDQVQRSGESGIRTNNS